MEVSTSSSSPTRTRARSGEPIYAPNSLDKILTGHATPEVKGCNYNCGCKKVGLFCSQVCTNCRGQFCSNVESNTTDENAYDINEEISDPSFSLEKSIEIQQQGEEEGSEQERITVEEFEDYLDDF
ncbi:hypothetical protein AVEN_74867-1 [Araneus ventricosus]|uniref:Tesmin/TSO1-like CXC domain-containing protein n=1 Tax=Araneus ventricosus TaxID=182803 RepID=A0A4Y2SEA9_ARAVE|nr:hypothetical protein AVEN_74867-1 [Araneus ventricosus]